MSDTSPFGRVRAVLRKLMQNSTFRGVAMIGSGTAMGQVIQVAATPIISRLYGPQAYGALGIFSGVLMIGAILVTSRFEVAIPLPEDDGEGRDILVLAIALACFLVGLTSLGALGWWLLAKPGSLAPPFRPMLWTIPLGMFGIGCYQTMSYWAIRKRLYREISMTRLNQSVAGVGTQVVLYRLPPAGLGLMLGAIAVQAFGLRILLKAFRKTRPSGPLPSLSRLVSLGRKYFSISAFGTATALAGAIGDSLPSFILARAFGLEIAGLYLMAAKLFSIPSAMVGGAVAQVFMGEASQRLRTAHQTVPIFFQTVHNKLRWVGAAILTLGLLSPFFLPLVLGAKWHAAGAVAVILAPMAAVDITVRPLFNITVIGNRPSLQLYTGLLPLGLSIIGLGVPTLLGASSHVALISYSSCRILSYWITYRIYLGVARKIGKGSGNWEDPSPAAILPGGGQGA